MAMCKKTIYDDIENESTMAIIKSATGAIGNTIIAEIPIIGGILTQLIPTVYSEIKKISFYDFLSSLSHQLDELKYRDKSIERLQKKLENPANYIHLASILDAVFFAKSKKARGILGVIVAKYLHDETIPYEELIISYALKDLLDDDLDFFMRFMEEFIKAQKEIPIGNTSTQWECYGVAIEDIHTGTFYHCCSPTDVISATAFYKLKNLQIFGEWSAGSIHSEKPPQFQGRVNSISEKLFEYMQTIK